MISTFGVLPSHTGVLNGVEVPLEISVEPLDGNSIVISSSDFQLPRCTRCSAYLCSSCAHSAEAWCCGVCSQIMNMKKPVPEAQISASTLEVVESGECQPLFHSIIVFSPVKSIIKQYLTLLPPNAPLSLSTYTDKFNMIPMGTVSQILEEIDAIPFPNQQIPFETAANELIHVFRNTSMPVWHRIFISSPPSDMKSHTIMSSLKHLYKAISRVDFFFFGSSYSQFLTELVQSTPGISRIFCPVNEGELPSALFSDASRGFGFQLLAVFRAGVAYGVNFVTSPFMASEICENYIRIPVLPSKTASLSFALTPPKENLRLRFQTMQCVVKFVRWNPNTNRLSHLFRIISQEYKISSNLTDLVQSISSSVLFTSWLHQAQKLPLGQQSLGIIDRTKAIVSIINANEKLKPLVKMAFLAKSHPALSTAFWDRLSMGSLLSLSSPRSVEAQFSYSVEVWDYNDTLLEEGLIASEKRRKGNFIFLVKSFPSLFVLSKTGSAEIVPHSKMSLSIERFKESCEPILIRTIQSQVDQVKELLSVDEEEGLAGFLDNIGVTSL